MAHIDRKMVVGKFSFVVDEEMANCAQEYVDHIRSASAGAEWLKIEQRFSLDALDPPLEAGGTADATYYFREQRLLCVDDLKTGRGVVVEVAGNPQGRSYALGALLAYPDLDVEQIRVTIIQPRAEHRDGRIRSETFHVAELADWTHDLMAAMRRSKQALDEFEAIRFKSDSSFPDWAEKWLATGQCTFCSAKAICPKLRSESLALAGRQAAQWFEEVGDAPIVLPDPKMLTGQEIARLLDGFDMLTSWVNAVRAYAQHQAESGNAIPGYQLVQSTGNRKWEDEDATIRILWSLKLTREQIFTEKLKSPAQIEKVLGAKRKSEIADLVVRPVTGKNLVAQTKTTREALPSSVERHFEQM